MGLASGSGSTPKERDGKIGDVYPWGTQWPPPRWAGNFDPTLKVDDFERTSPVGSFAANQVSLFDLGGNVWEWCEDLYCESTGFRMLRGGSWLVDDPRNLLSSSRNNLTPDTRFILYGFRVVLVGVGSAR